MGDLAWARARILRWFRNHGRAFPWRNTSDPYLVLVAEIMLKRTWAAQVRPIYHSFISQYPDVGTLSKARPADLEKMLWPLGLHRRASDLIAIAKALVVDFGSSVPQNREDLKSLPGVGDYVAGAVLSIALHKQEWIVDTNVLRVLSRFFGLEFAGEGRRSPLMIELAKTYSKTRSPRNANLGLIDIAASICIPRSPNCSECPLKSRCRYIVRQA